ncbi:MAG: aconitase family protein, partial [Chloroflexota bacterium]|nr:aconitase family protein [Chloroflexota bacterium]
MISEEALILPGQLIIGADSHTTHFGWLGAFGAGVGRTEIAALWATGELWMRVPNSILVKLTGQLNSSVTTKDLCLHLIGQVSSDGGLYASIEFCGESISELSIDSRTVIPNMMAELGAKNAYLPPDKQVFEWLANKLKHRLNVEAISKLAIYPDIGATYSEVIEINLEKLEPQVSVPHQVDNV